MRGGGQARASDSTTLDFLQRVLADLDLASAPLRTVPGLSRHGSARPLAGAPRRAPGGGAWAGCWRVGGSGASNVGPRLLRARAPRRRNSVGCCRKSATSYRRGWTLLVASRLLSAQRGRSSNLFSSVWKPPRSVPLQLDGACCAFITHCPIAHPSAPFMTGQPLAPASCYL